METKNKEIFINNESLVGDIQDAFSQRYPFLKIDFLQTDKGAKTLKSRKIDPATSLKQLANGVLATRMDINDRRTILEITHDFEHSLGVVVQVSRKCGNVWNVISITEGWTLESQNSAGEFISSEMMAPGKSISRD